MYEAIIYFMYCFCIAKFVNFR